MSLLSDIFQQNQQIAQNPTRVIKTPLQTAYDNYLKAQNNAQNTKEDEWGSAIGHSINGIAKIIASQAIKNPYERAGATRNLDNFDDRQDAMVRNWALQRMKNRNDYVQQAREQLGLAREDDDKNYNRELTAQQIAYKKAQDELNQKNIDREFANKLAQQDIMNKRADQDAKIKQDISDLTIKKLQAEVNALQFANTPEGQKAKAEAEEYDKQLKDLEKRKKEADTIKAERENSPEYIAKKEKEEQYKTYVATAKELFSKGLISNEDLMKIEKNPELAEYLMPSSNFLGFKSDRKMELPKNIDNDPLGVR